MKKLQLLILVFLVITSCNNEVKTTATEKEETHQKHWSYQGETSPEHWEEFLKDSDCDGLSQSPINIIEFNVLKDSIGNKLQFIYTPKTKIKLVSNNGHSIQFDYEEGDAISYKGETYKLFQLHFHEPSEHTINGVRYPIEIHLVHKSETNELTVIGILGKEGEESQLFEFFESFLPIKNGETIEVDQELELKSLLPKSKEYYTYSGSLTTPPCSENVNWIVFKEPIILSVEEVLKLKENMPVNNYRNEQPLNDRVVFSNKIL